MPLVRNGGLCGRRNGGCGTRTGGLTPVPVAVSNREVFDAAGAIFSAPEGSIVCCIIR